MLDGQGADEVLGGYHGYFPVDRRRSCCAERRLLSYARFHREHKALLGAELRSAARARRLERPAARPQRAVTGPASSIPLPAGPGLLSSELRDRLRRDYQPDPPGSRCTSCSRTQTESVGLPSLLRFEDRNSMAHSIEARVPFLDHRVVEFAFRLPLELKIKGVETKHVLREAMRGVLPERIRARKDKIGFRAEPHGDLDLAERHRDSLLANRTRPTRSAGSTRTALAAALLDGTDRSTETEFLAWRAINVKLWLRLHWGDGNDPLA